MISESLYEDENFVKNQLAALVASKVGHVFFMLCNSASHPLVRGLKLCSWSRCFITLGS